MRVDTKPVLFFLVATFAALVTPRPAVAHLMVEQRGTINIVDGGAFLVLSVPSAALMGVDDDGDGLLSAAELRAHHGRIAAQVRRGLTFTSDAVPRPLEGLLINLGGHDAETASSHVVVMGRFSLGPTPGVLRFETRLFGRSASERSVRLRARRGSDTHEITLTPARPRQTLFGR